MNDTMPIEVLVKAAQWQVPMGTQCGCFHPVAKPKCGPRSSFC